MGQFDFFGREFMMMALPIAAILIALIAIIQFRLKSTTISPQKLEQSTELVTNGIYDVTRNPMYLGLLLLLIAFGLYLQNAFNTMTAALFVYYINRFQIQPEEEQLTQKFGKLPSLQKGSTAMVLTPSISFC